MHVLGEKQVVESLSRVVTVVGLDACVNAYYSFYNCNKTQKTHDC
jgi:hypothetical protein